MMSRPHEWLSTFDLFTAVELAACCQREKCTSTVLYQCYICQVCREYICMYVCAYK